MGEPKELYDLIVIDVDHSPADRLSETDQMFYTRDGLIRTKAHLRKGGILAVWSYAEDSEFADALRFAFEQVRVEPVRTMNTLVGHEQTDWLFFGTT